MEGKLSMTIVAVVVSILVVLLLSYAGIRKYLIPSMTQDYITEQVNQAVKDKDTRIKDLNKQIAVLSKQLHESQKKYAHLRNLVEQKVREAESIKQPETRDEIRKRFTDLGYPPDP